MSEYDYFETLMLRSVDLAEQVEEQFFHDGDVEPLDSTTRMQNLILAHIMLHLCSLNDKLDKLMEGREP